MIEFDFKKIITKVRASILNSVSESAKNSLLDDMPDSYIIIIKALTKYWNNLILN